MKKTIKIFSLIMSFILFMGVFSSTTTVFAEEYNQYIATKEYEESLLTQTVLSEGEGAEIVCEVEEKRDEFSKTYKRADGSYTSVVSQTPLHTLKDGEWKEIDNTLKAEGYTLKNTDGSFDIEFPQTISEDEKITVTNNGERIAFSVNDIDSSSAVVTTPETDENNIIEKDLSKTVSEITYESVDESTDVQYVVSSGFVKENIIVDDKSGLKDIYSFDIEKGNLTVILDDSNNLNLKNEKNENVFTIPAPVMTDANNVASYDIDVTVENADKSVLTLTYTPSKEWLNSHDRAYPIVIDPVIALPDLDDTLIEDTVILNKSDDASCKNTNYSNSIEGEISSTQETHGEVLVKINVDAFSFCKDPNIEVVDFNYIGTGHIDGGNVLAKPINGTWDSKTITYDDVHPSDNSTAIITYEDKIIDYFTGDSQTGEKSSKTLCFNITQLFKEWIKGERANNGFALVAENEQTSGVIFLAGDYTPASNTYAFNTYCTIDYIDTSANNDSYEYLTQEVGRAGTASVNAFTRGLSLARGDVSLFGNTMPVGINFNYRGAFNNFIELYTSILEVTGEETELEFPYGNNWLPSYLQTIFQVTDNQYQVFVGDGTIAVFNREEETSDGTTITSFKTDDTSTANGYELKFVDQSAGENFENLKLISPSGETAFFNEYGFVSEIHEGTANPDGTYDKTVVVFDADNPLKIDFITDGVGRKYDFVYDEDLGLLTEINCLAADGTRIKAGTTNEDLKILYNYDNNKNLIGVTYPDKKSVSYTYSGTNLIKVQNIDDYSIHYAYDTLGKVIKITEKSGNTQGNFINLKDLNNHQVKITDAYTGVKIHQFGKDGKLHYTFDEKGNIYKSDYAPVNEEILSVNGWDVEPENLLKNGSFNTVAGNSPVNWSNAFNIVATDVGDNCCNVFSTEETTKLQNQTVDIDGGKSFTFSLYAKYNGEEVQATDKLYLSVTAVDADENEISKSVQIVPTSDFEQYSVSVSTTSETDYVIVEFGLKNKTGNFLVNNAQLESGNGTAEFNYIENGTFSILSGNTPDKWSKSTVVEHTINNESVNAVVFDGGLPFYTESGDVYTLNDSVSAVTQNVKINGKKGDVYSVGGWFNGLFDDNYINPDFMPEYATTNTQLTSSTAQIKVTYTYNKTVTDGEGNEIAETATESFAVDFAPHNDDWQYAKDSFALKGDVGSVDVTVITKNIPSTSYATNISLTKDSDSIFIEEESTDDTVQTAEDTEDQICTCGCEDCFYGENCPCTGAINNDCQCPECLREETTTQDAFGNTLSVKSTDGIKYIETLSSYTSDGNYLATYTDENGNVTTCDYNTLNSILESVTSPIGTGNETTTTSYEYDEIGNVVSVSTELSADESQELEYVYTNDRLTEIVTPNGKYKITYDVWGQVLSVNVVNTDGSLSTLVEYTYNKDELRTQVASATYNNASANNNFSSNSNTYKYTYDDNGNVTSIKLNEAEKHNITYSSLGEITCIENENGRKVQYADNGVYIYNADNELVYTSVYDTEGVITEENYGVMYKEHDPEYDYDSATGSSANTTALDVAEKYRVEQKATTDWFGRAESHLTTIYDITEETETVPASTIGKISTEYEYPVTDNGKTSSGIEKIVNKTYNGDSESYSLYDGYYYEYDKQNKISAEKKLNADGTTTNKYSYEYDKLGQLVRCNDAVENKTYTYTYDSNGNILTKSEYAYTLSSELGTATNTVTYSYDEQWKDKLTSVGNKTISYDGMGNPVSYLGATLTWEGRTLTSYEDETRKVQYEYDENGMRYRTTVTSKEDGQVGSFEYVWVDGKLISIVFVGDGSTSTAKYIYNDFDEPVGMIVTGAEGTVSNYYYLKNAQGDITNIVSSSGGKMVEFTYDVFGNQTAHYQSDPSTMVGMVYWAEQVIVHALTPFGYRGYCYDVYSGLYYLQSRYYDPQTGRFINADDTNYLNATGTVLGCNLFAYCENDPVNNVDPTGFYSADAAIKYAKTWWYDRNIKYYSYFSNGDCANFVSQCLYAGGFSKDSIWYSYYSTRKHKGWDSQVRIVCEFNRYNQNYVFVGRTYWYNVSDAWSLADDLFNYLVENKKYKTLTIKNKRTLQKYIDEGLIKSGCPAFFSRYGRRENINHAVLIGKVTKNDVYYYAHSSNRNAESNAKNGKYGFRGALKTNETIYVVLVK